MSGRGSISLLALPFVLVAAVSEARAEAPADPPLDAPAGEAVAPASDGPSKEQCIDANEAAQRLLRKGELGAAKAQVETCVAASCPEVIRSDCSDLDKAIAAAMPTIRFDVRDRQGNVVSEVRISMGGQPLAERLDGTPFRVDPGTHRFEFEAPGLPRTSRTISLKAGEERSERVDMVDRTGPVLKTTGLVVAGIGILAIGWGTFRGIRAKLRYDDAIEHCPSGPRSCSPAGVSGGRDAHDDAAAATTSIIVGTVLGAGGAALYFLVPEEGFRVSPAVGSRRVTLEAGTTW